MKIRIIILYCLLVCSIITAFAQKRRDYILSGQFKGLPDGTKIYLVTQERDTVAQTISNNDQFIFRGRLLLNGRFHFLNFDKKVSGITSKSIFLENRPINVVGELGKSDVIVTGSLGDADHKEVERLLMPIKAKSKDISTQLDTLNKRLWRHINSIEKVEIEKKTNALKVQQKNEVSEKYREIGFKWIITHLNSLYAPYLIIGYRNIFTQDEIKSAYEHLTPEVKAGYYGTKLKNDIEAKEAASKVAEGKPVPDFMLTEPSGSKLSILNIASKNKYTLIDCWASWCGPCRAEVPKLKEIYAAFKDKGFMIVGISSDKDMNKWKKAVAEDATPWPHVIESEKKEITNTYDLRAIPAYMLIDNKGRLVAFDVLSSSIKPFGPSLRGEELKKTLEKLLR